MGTVRVNSVTINSVSGSGYGPFTGKRNIVSIDLGHVPWTNNIMEDTFRGCANLTTITNFPTTVTKFVNGVFAFCNNLENIQKLPNSITNMIGSEFNNGGVFQYSKVNNCDFLPNSLQTASCCFVNCNYLTRVNSLPSTLVNMSQMFYWCRNLNYVQSLPPNVTNLYYTFSGCRALTNAPVIPESAIDIDGTFQNCVALTGDIYVTSSNITSASYMFGLTSLPKNVYIPFKYANNVNTRTYNSFISAGYTTDGLSCGVYLKDIGTL